MDSQLVMWIVLAAALAVLEIATMGFVALYFALGAIAAAIVAWLGADMPWQLLAFAATGVVLMVATRPFLKRKLESPAVHTNVDRMVGKRGVVTIAIDNDANTGQIRVGTEYWTARWPEAAPGATIGVDERVEIIAVEGVTARVRPLVVD
jgi:membrane protein implicated in regulation of membrane protease activity